MCLGSWDLVFSEPVSYADFFHDIGPVVHRARDSNDNRFRRQPEKSVLTKPHQFRIGVIQPGRAARHPQGMFGRCDTEPASIVDRRVRHKSPYGHPSGGLRLTICHSFRRRGRRRQGSGCSRLMSPKVTLRLSGVHPSVDLGVVLTATHGADDGERPAGCHTVSRSGQPCVDCRIPLYGIKRAACGGADVAKSLARLACPSGRSRTLRAACGRARAGRPRRAQQPSGSHNRRRRRHPRLRAVQASPSHVHGIVHVALSMFKAAARRTRWSMASLDIAAATRSAARMRGPAGSRCMPAAH